MKKLSADFILSPYGKLITNHNLIVDDKGEIIDLLPADSTPDYFYEGILSPGFINTHCHLELSYMQDKIVKGHGLPQFINDIILERKKPNTTIYDSIVKGNTMMWQNGIQAVADICNTSDSFECKKNSPLRYHSFIEVFNFNPKNAEACFNEGEKLWEKAVSSHRNSSLVPHAPYSVPKELFIKIQEHSEHNHTLWSIHNQETPSENEMFIDGTGKLMTQFKNMGIDLSWFNKSNISSLQSIQQYMPAQSNRLLVHNIYMGKSDLEVLKQSGNFEKTWFCLCPKANIYIENTLPDVNLLFDYNCNLTIGTDSLASNDTLSILEEIKVLAAKFPKITLQNMLKWATYNGAQYMNWFDLGSFKKGNVPGVINITKIRDMKLTKGSEAIRLY